MAWFLILVGCFAALDGQLFGVFVALIGVVLLFH